MNHRKVWYCYDCKELCYVKNLDPTKWEEAGALWCSCREEE